MRFAPPLLLAALAAPAFFFGAQGCDPNIPEDWDVSGYSECRDTEAATEEYYATVMKPFFDQYCAYCHASDNEDRHGAPNSTNFDTFEAAKRAPTRTWARVSTFEMPPMGRLPNARELDTLLDWLNCVSDPPLEVPEELGDCPDGSTVTEAQVNAVLETNCTRCHSEALTGAVDRQDAPEGIDWDDAGDLLGYGDNAYIWSRIASGEMPVDAAMEDADAVLLWEYLSCNP